jgi:hypothetical protein
MIEYVNALNRSYGSIIRRAEKEDKRYLQVLSEITSFLTILKEFLSKAATLENVLRDLKVGKVCYKWFYTETDTRITLSRLNPHVSVFYTGMSIGVTNTKHFLAELNDRVVKVRINNYIEEIPVTSIQDIVLKRSVIIKALSEAKNALQKYGDEFTVCTKQLQRGVVR